MSTWSRSIVVRASVGPRPEYFRKSSTARFETATAALPVPSGLAIAGLDLVRDGDAVRGVTVAAVNRRSSAFARLAGHLHTPVASSGRRPRESRERSADGGWSTAYAICTREEDVCQQARGWRLTSPLSDSNRRPLPYHGSGLPTCRSTKTGAT